MRLGFRAFQGSRVKHLKFLYGLGSGVAVFALRVQGREASRSSLGFTVLGVYGWIVA